jgi:8-oxo-dGTP pyrophosphatase MutT (NUDIX family)
MSKVNKKIPRAGFIPYYVEGDELYIMIMVPSNPKFGGDKPQIAKGKIDPGEDARTAALREASEEVGLVESNVCSVEPLGNFLGYTEIFYGLIKDPTNFTETTYETGASYWMAVEDFLLEGRDIHKPIVKAFLRAIAS